MALKNILSRTGGWLRSHRLIKLREFQPQVDNEGLISNETHSQTDSYETPQIEQKDHVVISPETHSPSKPQESFNKLIEKLQGINDHLGTQVTQHEDLMNRMEQLPKLVENFPNALENQKQLVEQLLEQLKSNAAKDMQFVDAVEKIPNETLKQTDALVNINNQLSAAADIDAQLSENFHKFTETLGKVDQSTIGQTDSILQMSKTFAASDRYLKYIISRQNKRFMWMFMVAIGICFISILVLTSIIIYVK
jgi:DNA repair exonuclease SbcCD ATPase subunit